jgi:hypothetical protein
MANIEVPDPHILGRVFETIEPWKWRIQLSTWRMRQTDPVFVSNGNFQAMDFTQRSTFGLVFRNCDFRNIAVGASFPLRKLSDLDGNKGIVVIPRTLPSFPDEPDPEYETRCSLHNIRNSILLIKTNQGTVAFEAPHKSLGEQLPRGRAQQILQPNRMIAALIKRLDERDSMDEAKRLKYGWEHIMNARDFCLELTIPREERDRDDLTPLDLGEGTNRKPGLT